MNLKLNMKDISKGTLQIICFLNDAEKTHMILRKHVSMKCLSVMSSLLHHVLWGRSQVYLFFAIVMSPADHIYNFTDSYKIMDYIVF